MGLEAFETVGALFFPGWCNAAPMPLEHCVGVQVLLWEPRVAKDGRLGKREISLNFLISGGYERFDSVHGNATPFCRWVPVGGEMVLYAIRSAFESCQRLHLKQ